MTEIESLQLSKRILTRIHASGVGCLSLDVIEREFNIDLYLLQEAVKTLVESGLLETNPAPSKDFPYNKMLIITSKGNYSLNTSTGLEVTLKKKSQNRDSNAKVLKSLVAKDNLKDVLSLLQAKVQTNDHINYLVMQSARFHEIERAMNLNLIDFNSASANKAHLRMSLLNLIDELSANETEEQLYQPQEEVFVVSEPIIEFHKDYKSLKLDTNASSIILRFLQEYDKWYFSPLRIKLWGGKQDGFHELENLTSKNIKTTLETLFFMDRVLKTVSKKGNSIYKFKPRKRFATTIDADKT